MKRWSKQAGGGDPRWMWEGGLLGLAWLAIVVWDRLWLALDRHVPDWDEADYLTGALNYGRAIAAGSWGDWLSGEWWTSLWLLSSKIPPLVYGIAGGITNGVGRSADGALWVNAIAALVLLAATYGLGRCLFDHADNVDNEKSEPSTDPQQLSIGFWAALLVLVLPGVLTVRRIFVLDYAVCAAVAAILWGLTRWR
ncbi:MAG: hypothetical protein EAZ61_13610, partial [Oscillatoriales cyanobacterium]